MANIKTTLDRFTQKIDAYAKTAKKSTVLSKIRQYNELLKEEFHNSINNRITDRKGIVQGLQSRIKDKNIAIVFGAGVSCAEPFNLPSWGKLLQRAVVGDFLTYYDTTDIPDTFDDIITMLTKSDEYSGDYFGSFDLYELAQILEEERKNRERTNDIHTPYEEIRHKVDCNMYETVRYALGKGLEKNEDWERIKYPSYSVYKLANDDKSRIKTTIIWKLSEFIANNDNVRHIITYNYDNAFEYTYEQVGHKRDLSSVFIDDQLGLVDDNKLPVYHVHGYTPIFDTKNLHDEEFKSAMNSTEGKRLILSENSYDDIEHSSYKWRNTVQIDSFLKYNCLFFGFSATDKNFKRIVKLMDWHTEQHGTPMHIEDDDRIQHYIFLAVDDFVNNIFGTSLERLTQEHDDTSILTSPGRYKKRVRHIMYSLLENLKSLNSLSAYIPSEKEKITNAIISIENLLNDSALNYCVDDNVDDYCLSGIVDETKLTNIPKEIEEIIKNIDKMIKTSKLTQKNKKVIKNIIDNMECCIIDFVGDDARLALRLEFLYYTLQSKRRYLRKMHIYPLWITARDSEKYVDKFFTGKLKKNDVSSVGTKKLLPDEIIRREFIKKSSTTTELPPKSELTDGDK